MAATDSDKNTALVSALKETAERTTRTTLAFLATAVYLGVSVASTSHDQILVNGSITFPILNAGVPCQLFYIVAPFLLVALHANWLLEDDFLGGRIRSLRAAAKGEDLSQQFPWINIAVAFGWQAKKVVVILLSGLRLFIAIGLPLLLLLYMQVKFLPYHSLSITRYHRAMVVLDLCLVAVFFISFPVRAVLRRVLTALPSLSSRQQRVTVDKAGSESQPAKTSVAVRGRGRSRLGQVLRAQFLVLIFLTAAMAAIWLSFGMAVVPDACVHQFSSWQIQPYLNLVGKHLPAGGDAAGRDLRCADFSGAIMAGFDFRGSKLSGAQFAGAFLGKAKFGRRREADHANGAAGGRETSLGCGADDLDEAGDRTDLRKAIFDRANLSEADFSNSLLAQAQFKSAELSGAMFSGARANGADLTDAYGVGVVFDDACLRGANLLRALLLDSSFLRAHLEVANLLESALDLSRFSGATLIGSDMRSAHLNGVSDITLKAVDLRGADLSGVDLCTAAAVSSTSLRDQSSASGIDMRKPFPRIELADLRDAGFTPNPPDRWAILKRETPYRFALVPQREAAVAHIADPLLIQKTARIDRRAANLLFRDDLPGALLSHLTEKSLPPDSFYAKVTAFLVSKSNEELLPFLVEVALSPGRNGVAASEFDRALACAIILEQERRSHTESARSRSERDPYAHIDSNLLRAHCPVDLRALQGAPQPPPAAETLAPKANLPECLAEAPVPPTSAVPATGLPSPPEPVRLPP